MQPSSFLPSHRTHVFIPSPVPPQHLRGHPEKQSIIIRQMLQEQPIPHHYIHHHSRHPWEALQPISALPLDLCHKQV